MREKVNILLPCVTFFSAGETVDGVVNLLMQATLFFWPLAVHWARQFRGDRAVIMLLNEFAAAYPVPVQRAKLGKRFHGPVFSNGIVFGKPRNRRRAA
jgi:hypothetical protein